MDGLYKLFHCERLAQVIVHASFQASLAVALHCISSDCNYGNSPAVSGFAHSNAFGAFQSIHFGHAPVHEDHLIVRPAINCFQSLQTARGNVKADSGSFSQHAQKALLHRVVLDDQNRWLIHAPPFTARLTVHQFICNRESTGCITGWRFEGPGQGKKGSARQAQI